MNGIVDVRVTHHGSVTLVKPLTPAAHVWVDEHAQLESWQWLGASFAIEPRYVENLVSGMEHDGLQVEVN